MRAERLVWVGAVLVVACGGSASTSGAGASGGGGRANAGAGAGGSSGTHAGLGGGGGMSTAGSASGGAAPRAVIVTQFRDGPGCLPRPLPTDTNSSSPTFGQSLCQVVEAQASTASTCDCKKPGRAPVGDPNLVVSIQQQLMGAGVCGDTSPQMCPSNCMCEIVQEVGAAATACQTDPVAAAANPSVPPGFCYANDPASPALAQCPASQQGKILFVSPTASPTPTPSDLLFLACSNPLTGS